MEKEFVFSIVDTRDLIMLNIWNKTPMALFGILTKQEVSSGQIHSFVSSFSGTFTLSNFYLLSLYSDIIEESI